MLLKNIVIICLVRKKGFKSYIWILFLHNKQLVFNCIGHLHKSLKIIYIEKVIGMIFYLFYLSKNNHKKVLCEFKIHTWQGLVWDFYQAYHFWDSEAHILSNKFALIQIHLITVNLGPFRTASNLRQGAPALFCPIILLASKMWKESILPLVFSRTDTVVLILQNVSILGLCYMCSAAWRGNNLYFIMQRCLAKWQYILIRKSVFMLFISHISPSPSLSPTSCSHGNQLSVGVYSLD